MRFFVVVVDVFVVVFVVDDVAFVVCAVIDGDVVSAFIGFSVDFGVLFVAIVGLGVVDLNSSGYTVVFVVIVVVYVVFVDVVVFVVAVFVVTVFAVSVFVVSVFVVCDVCVDGDVVVAFISWINGLEVVEFLFGSEIVSEKLNGKIFSKELQSHSLF